MYKFTANRSLKIYCYAALSLFSVPMLKRHLLIILELYLLSCGLYVGMLSGMDR